MSKPEDLVVAARASLGTPFHHQGRQPGRGLDCVGVIVCAARQCGLGNYDVSNYARLPQGAAMHMHLLAAGLCPVEMEDAMAGDVLAMRFTREMQHLALRTDRGILHAWQQVGRVVEHRLDAGWRRRILGTYRFAEFI